MEEIIQRIEEIDFKRSKDDYHTYSGYQVVTDKQTIKMGIDMQTDCCENPGYLMSEDDLQKFIGAKLLAIELSDNEINKVERSEYFEGGLMFVDIKTDRGVLQFKAYNDQNGYYGHEAVVVSSQLNHEEYL